VSVQYSSLSFSVQRPLPSRFFSFSLHNKRKKDEMEAEVEEDEQFEKGETRCAAP
jgi:hypothetical protein